MSPLGLYRQKQLDVLVIQMPLISMFPNFFFFFVGTFIFQVWTIIDQRSMNTANVFFFTSSLPFLVITISRSE